MADERQQWRDLGRKLANAPMNTTTYALLSQWVYGYLPNSFIALKPESVPLGWEFVAASSSDNGYKAVALRKSGTSQVVIVNAGTDFSESLNGYSSDWIDGNLRGGPGSQIDSAIQFAQSIVGLPNVASVYPTGHSLGGGLAETQVAYLRASGYQHVAGVGYHSAGFGGRIKDFIQSQYGLSVPDILSYMTHYQSQADINYTLGVGRPTNYLNEGFGLGYLGSTVFVGGEYYRSRYPLSSEYVYFPEGLGTHSNFWKKFEDGTAFTSHIVIDITGRRTRMPGILPAGDITVVSPDKLDLYITELVELERARTTYLGGWNGTISINDAGDLTYTVNGSAPIVVSRFTLPSTRPQYSGLTQSNGVTTYRPAVPDNGDWQDLGAITVVGTRIGNGRYQIVDLLGVRTLVEAFSGVLRMVIDIVEPRRQDVPQGSTVHYENGYRYLVDPDGEFLGGIPQVDAIPVSNRSEFLEIAGARIAGRLGSTLGQMLARDNQFVAAFAGQVVGDAASQLAGAFLQGVFRSDVDLSSKVTGAVLDIVNGRSINLGNALGNAAIGTASSYLAAELADALNLDGVVGEVFGVVSTTVLNVAINNVAANLPILSRMDLRPIGWGEAPGLVGSALGSYFGQKLAANVVSPNTQAVAIFSSLNAAAAASRGFAVGASIGSAFGPIGTIVGGVIGATVSAFVNAVVSTFFGNLFSRKRTRMPSALAEIYLNYVNDQFLLGASSASNGGNIELARLMANTAADTLNGIVKVIGGDVIQTSAIPVQTFGHSGSTLYVKYGSYQKNVQSADEAVEYSVIRSAQQIQIAGGDIYIKRVLKSAASDIAMWSSDIRVASDYAHYVHNRESINAVIRDLPDSAFSAAWLVTLQRASELKLSEWSVSDFYGGLRGFLDSINIQAYGVYMENIQAAAMGAGARLSVRGVEYTTDPESSAARIWRLYDAALDRTADTNGLHSWTGLLDAGRSLHSIAEGFLGSAEFRAAGTLTNAQFVLLIYKRALNRTPAQWEIDAKVSELNGGRSRAQILVDISESPEHRAITAAAIAAGLSVQRGLGAFSLLAQAEGGGRSVVVDDLTKVGYTKLTEGNTSGRDFLDFSQRTSAVDWRDVSQTTEYETYYDQYGYEYQQEITVTHTGGDDIVVGSRYGDYLSGAAGWDWIDGGEGDDTLEGGDGNDVLLGGAGNDQLFGRADDDYLAGGDGNDTLNGEDGNDTIVGGAGLDTLNGGGGDDVLIVDYNDGQSDYIVGGAGIDTLSFERSGAGITLTMGVASNTSGYFGAMGDRYKEIENVTGTRFNDTIVGDAANNVLFGGDGDDVLDGAGGTNNILEGGAGADTLRSTGDATLSYEHSNAGVFIDMTSREAFGGHATGDQWGGMDHLTGSGFADELKGDAGSNRIKGLDGDDWIVATVGSDVYEGGDGLDTVDYSTGFATGTSTYQTWVNDGYWEWDDWQQQNVWVENGGHYETVTSTRLGLQVNGGIADWRVVDGKAGTHSLIGVEHIIGTAGDDYIGMTGGDDYITGGKGNDTLAGGGGSDTYYFNRGDGFDQLVEDNSGSNTLSFSGDVKVGDLGFGWRSHATGVFDIYIQGTSDHIQINGNVVAVGNNKLKVIDFNGAGQLDVSQLTRMKVGGNGNDVIYGEPNGQSDLIAGYGGNDILYGAPSNGWETQGNVFIGGSGNDQFNASTGDDQYAFDVGDGQDVIYDTGGDDTLVFGATVTADSVRTEVVNGDLRIFYSGAGDYVTVSGGGTRLNDVSTGVTTWNTVEFINAGGTWIDIRKLDINWLNQDYYGGGWAPIVLDLGDDGLDLVGVDQSQIVSRLDSGQVARTGWVGATDGMLAVDRDGDGQINHLSEISFTQDKDGAKTDLEGLRAWDTNGDGKITILDEGWSKLKVWVDRNQNGRSTDGELRTLEQAGITTIDLTGQGTGMTAAMTRDNFVHNTLSFTWSDGRQGTAYDVNLARKLLQEKGLTREQVIAAWGTLGADGELGRLLNDPAAQALLAATLGETALRQPSALVQKGMTRADILSAAPMLEDIDLDVVVPAASSSITLETILANAQFDFSDHDNTYAEDEKRLREKLEAALGGDNYVRTDEGVLGSLFEGEGVRGAFGHAFGRPDIDDGASDAVMGAGLNEAAAGAPLSLADGQVGRPERVLEADRGRSLNDDVQMPEIDQVASLLSAVTDESDVWAPAEFSRASSGAGRQWWRSEVLSPDDLSVAAPVGTFDLSSAIEANAQGAVASQHQQLVQALAAFGPKAGGGSSAIWKRSGEVEDGHLAGSSSDTGRWRFAGPSRIHA